MSILAIGLPGIVLAHGSAAAQTTQEQDKILRTFQESVATLAAATAAIPGPRIFTLPVAMVFRQLMAKALDEQVHATHMAGVGTELPLGHHPVVFEPFPTNELHEFSAVLAGALPALPDPLEYRLIGNDLVLRDVAGDRIVAVLRDAVGRFLTVKR